MIGPLSRPFIRDVLAQMRGLQSRDRVVSYYPSEVECVQLGCGHDSITNSKKKIDCTSCDSRGYVTTWATQIITARVVRPEPLSFVSRDGLVMTEVSDLVLYVDRHERETIKRIRDEERAYLVVDEVSYRPVTIDGIGVTGPDEYRINCATYSPR